MDTEWVNTIQTVVTAVAAFYIRSGSKKDAVDVKIATSSAEQVMRLDTRVMGLQHQFDTLNRQVAKILPPDDRGPTSET